MTVRLRDAARRGRHFLVAEQDGSATLWNLFWLGGFCALLGLGVDTTAAINTQVRLQTVADAASHAAAMDLFPVSGTAVATALEYTDKNIPGIDGVVSGTDVTLGYWDRDARAFRTSNTPYLNAVRVVATRDAARANALASTFLRTVGFENWDISADSVSTYFGDMSLSDRCRKNGLLAGGTVRLTSNNVITGEYCVHGETGFQINQNNVVTCGVELSTPDPSGWESQSVGTPDGVPGICLDSYDTLTNEQMIEQVFVYRSIPSRAELEYQTVRKMVDAFVRGDLDNDPFNAIAPYLTRAQTVPATAFNALASAGTLAPGTLYVVSCGGGGGTLRPRGLVRNIGIYTDCVIDVAKATGTSATKPTKVKKGATDVSGTSGTTLLGGTTEAVGTLLGGTTEAIGTATATGTLCDPDLSTCETTQWLAEVVTPEMTCEKAVAMGYERYATYLDTAEGRTYRDGETVDTIAQDCAMEPGANGVWDNVFVFSTAFAGGDLSKKAVTFPNNMQLGRIDGCTEGGAVRIYAAGSLSTPAGAIVHGSHFVLLGDANLAAKADGTYGMTVEAAGDIVFAAQGRLGGCSAEESHLASDVVLTIRPIAIVN